MPTERITFPELPRPHGRPRPAHARRRARARRPHRPPARRHDRRDRGAPRRDARGARRRAGQQPLQGARARPRRPPLRHEAPRRGGGVARASRGEAGVPETCPVVVGLDDPRLVAGAATVEPEERRPARSRRRPRQRRDLPLHLRHDRRPQGLRVRPRGDGGAGVRLRRAPRADDRPTASSRRSRSSTSARSSRSLRDAVGPVRDRPRRAAASNRASRSTSSSASAARSRSPPSRRSGCRCSTSRASPTADLSALRPDRQRRHARARCSGCRSASRTCRRCRPSAAPRREASPPSASPTSRSSRGSPPVDGRSTAASSARIDPETGHDVAPGEVGELLMRGPTRFARYHDDPEQTALGDRRRRLVPLRRPRPDRRTTDASPSSVGSRTCSRWAARTSPPPRSRATC